MSAASARSCTSGGTARKVGEAHAVVRRAVPPLAQDRALAADIAALRAAIAAGHFDGITAGIPL